LVNARSPAERRRIHEGENFREHFHAAVQRFFQQLALGQYQPVLRDCRSQRAL
jgi:TnpA family transposase